MPSPTLNDYKNILTDVKIEDYWPSYQAVYVQSLRKIAHIRSYFGIEREFDRYYHLLKRQLRDGTNFDEMREEDVLQLAASRTFDADKVWPNPNLHIPLEKAHLSITKKDSISNP